LVIVEILAVGVIVPLLFAARHLRREQRDRARTEPPPALDASLLDGPLKESP
jgi:hypothetical protein